jgi:hypothetical protein
MKKIIMTAIMLAILGAPAFAGDLGNIIGVDMIMGITAGAAMGVAFSTPSYMGGSQADGTVFLVGAGWGAVAGAILGIGYGIYGVIDHINMRNKSTIKASVDSNEIFVQYNPEKTGIQITQKF